MMGNLNLKQLVPEIGIKHFNKNCGVFIHAKDMLDDSWYDIDWDVYLPSYGFNLQRPFVWTVEQNRELIMSILRENFIPKISVIQINDTDPCKRTKTKLQIIDGKQRLNAIRNFILGKFGIIFECKEYFIDDLDSYAQRMVKFYYIPGDIAYSYEPDEAITDRQKLEWFNRINFSGTIQDKSHMNRIKEILTNETR